MGHGAAAAAVEEVDCTSTSTGMGGARAATTSTGDGTHGGKRGMGRWIGKRAGKNSLAIVLVLALVLCIGTAQASVGDRLPDFKDCVKVCIEVNCEGLEKTHIPIHRRLMLWTCPSECDYTCQHITTHRRLSRDPPYREPILQFHGKWPFHRFLGMQEPFSVLFSLLNYLAHLYGLSLIRSSIPPSYPLRKYYIGFALAGMQAWVWSMLFHTRDLPVTETLDYVGAGASVMYGLFYAPVRIFRLDAQAPPWKPSLLRLWTLGCLALFFAHVGFLLLVRWDHAYNMAANVAAGVVQNLLWSWFSVRRYRALKRGWAAWPGLIVAWIISAMSLELLDFPPWGGMVDAHALWHAGTIIPTVWWYSFLVKDAEEDLLGVRLKA